MNLYWHYIIVSIISYLLFFFVTYHIDKNAIFPDIKTKEDCQKNLGDNNCGIYGMMKIKNV